MKKDSDTILIKRYASRRLYNTQTSDYVTLEEVAQFIRDGKDVKIVDRKSGVDLTRQYLLQIITDYETRGENVLPINVLTDIVRSYSDQAQDFIPDFLSQSYEMLKKQQALVLNALPPTVKKRIEPLKPIDGIEQWQKMQTEFLNQMMNAWSPTHHTQGPAPEADDLSEQAKTAARKSPAKKAAAKSAPKKTAAKSGRSTKNGTRSDTGKTASKPVDKAKEKEIAEIKKQLVALQSKLQDL